MRLRLIGAMGAAVVALATVAASDSSPVASSDEVLASLPAPHARTAAPSPVVARHRSTVVQHYVDLNSASRQELMTLPGIGAHEADRIVASRPYLTKTELVTKDVLPVGPFMSLRHLVVAMPKAQAKGGT
jgi:DNA uptake protein ComE-like DNA-binding protein